MKTGIELITEERIRQLTVLGWTPEHDEQHRAGEIAMAAVCYALPHHIRATPPMGQTKTFIDRFWPWEDFWWKPTPEDRVRELTKAGALIAGEIDRLQRAEGKV